MESAMQIGQPVGGENIVEIQHGSAAAATATAAQPPIGAGVTTAIGSDPESPIPNNDVIATWINKPKQMPSTSPASDQR